MTQIHDIGIRNFLIVFYGILLVWWISPEFLEWLGLWLMAPRFIDQVYFGAGCGVALAIFSLMVPRQEKKELTESSVGEDYLAVGCGLVLLALAYLKIWCYDIPLEDLPLRNPGKRIREFVFFGSLVSTSGFMRIAMSRVWKKGS